MEKTYTWSDGRKVKLGPVQTYASTKDGSNIKLMPLLYEDGTPVMHPVFHSAIYLEPEQEIPESVALHMSIQFN